MDTVQIRNRFQIKSESKPSHQLAYSVTLTSDLMFTSYIPWAAQLKILNVDMILNGWNDSESAIFAQERNFPDTKPS